MEEVIRGIGRTSLPKLMSFSEFGCDDVKSLIATPDRWAKDFGGLYHRHCGHPVSGTPV